MADTIRGDFGDTPCSDCGEQGGVYLKHWGPLVPPGVVGYFDAPCFFLRRYELYDEGRPAQPLGQKRSAALRAAAERAIEEEKPLRQVLAEDAERSSRTPVAEVVVLKGGSELAGTPGFMEALHKFQYGESAEESEEGFRAMEQISSDTRRKT